VTWERVPLKELGDWYGGGTPSKSNPAFWTDGDVPWLSPKDMGPEVLHGTQDHVTSEAVSGSSTKLVPAGSVAVVTRSGILERTIPVSIVPFATTMNQDMKAVVPRAGIDPRWIAWGLRAFERDLLRDTRKAGTTVASIEMPRWYGFKLPVPPLEEQRRIVAILEDHLSRLDAAEKMVCTAKSRIEALGHARRYRLFDDLSSTTAALLDHTTIANGQTPKGLIGSLSDARRPGAVPFYKVGDMNNAVGRWMDGARNFVDLTVAGSLNLHVRPAGTVIIPKRGGAIATNKKRILREPAALDLNTMGLMPGAGLTSSYLWHWLQTVDLGLLSDGSNVPQINGPQVRSMRLPVPDLQTQRTVSDELDEAEQEASRLSAACAAAARRSAALRRSLLSAAFSGRLTGSASEMSVVEGRIQA